MTAHIVVCDYGVGNVRNVERALQAAGARVTLSADPDAVAAAAGVVLPGVGSFGVAARCLRHTGLGAAVRSVASSGRPVLGVCLGLQLLFEGSDESPGVAGLGLLQGRVTRLRPAQGKVPHVGWNQLRKTRDAAPLQGVADGTYAYFVHAYSAEARGGDVVATSDHGGSFVAAVQRGSITGTQFHPEKSGALALQVYAGFSALCDGSAVAV